MADYENIILASQSGVATITLNRPEKLNAMTVAMVGELEAAVREVARDSGIKAVILTGAGRGFCSGADMGASDLKVSSPSEALEPMRQAARLVLSFRELPKPVIAAVNGPCVGGGLSLALACDIILAAEKARFGAPFVLRNLHPDFGCTFFLPRLIGPAKAADLLLTGRTITAAEADAMGLVSRVVPDESLLTAALEIAAALAKGPPAALSMTKASLNKSLVSDLPTMLELEARAQSMLFVTDDCREAMAAFLEKREPRFTGK